MDDAPDAVNITSQFVTVGANTKLNFFNMTSGAAVSRLQGFITLAGEGSELAINGVNLLKKTEHGDTTLVVDHAVPNCVSREIFRAVIDDRAHSVFQGRIIVRPDAQKTDGKMMTRALLLSDEARSRQQAGARDLCRRRRLRPRRDRRRARRQPAVLSAARAACPEKRGAGAADPGLRRRGDRAASPTMACASA